MKMSLTEFAEQIERSKSYNVSELYLSTIPAELYINNSMNVPATAERDLHKACMGKFVSDKDEADYYRLLELIAHKRPVYPFQPVISSKDVVGITLTLEGMQWTLNMRELRDFAANEIFGVINTPIIKINSKKPSCIKGVYTYYERGGKVTNIYRQVSGIQTVPAVSASYINIIENGEMKKVRIKGTLTIPVLKIATKYQKFKDNRGSSK